MATANSVRGTGVLTKGISVMRCIAEQGDAPTFSALLRETGLPKGTLHRILQALIAENLVLRRERDKTYQLGFDLLRLANAALEGMDLRDVAREKLIRLRDDTGETVNLVAIDRLEAIVVDRIDTPKAVNSAESIGGHIRLHCTAAGKAIAAFLPESDIRLALSRARLERYTPHTITSKKALKKHLECVRERGFATNEGETDLSVYGIAAPIFDVNGKVLGSVNLTIPRFRLKQELLADHIDAVVDTAEAISRDLGHTMSLR